MTEESKPTVSYQYIAGFFDGEGYITISKASHKSHSGSRYWLVASMVNTHKGVLDEIQKFVGGNIIFHKGSSGRKHHYRLTFYSRQAYNFIKSIEPYLIVKREEARLAMAYQESVRSYGSGHRLSTEELCFQDKCYMAIREKHGSKVILPIEHEVEI